MIQDQERCIGCHSCEIQCKSNKSLPVGPRLCQIVHVGPKMIDGKPRAAYVFMNCHHCDTPWCVNACPTGAMRKREKDGIVYIVQADCVGCKSCISACPWGAPQWNPETRKVEKCDFCMDRIDSGLKPACVTICLTQCLTFDRAEQISSGKREQWVKKTALIEG